MNGAGAALACVDAMLASVDAALANVDVAFASVGAGAALACVDTALASADGPELASRAVPSSPASSAERFMVWQCHARKNASSGVAERFMVWRALSLLSPSGYCTMLMRMVARALGACWRGLQGL